MDCIRISRRSHSEIGSYRFKSYQEQTRRSRQIMYYKVNHVESNQLKIMAVSSGICGMNSNERKANAGYAKLLTMLYERWKLSIGIRNESKTQSFLGQSLIQSITFFIPPWPAINASPCLAPGSNQSPFRTPCEVRYFLTRYGIHQQGHISSSYK